LGGGFALTLKTFKCFCVCSNSGIAAAHTLVLVLIAQRFHRLAELASVLFHVCLAPGDP
jgi:hypothetical protein